MNLKKAVSQDIYFIPVILWILISGFLTISQPIVFERIVGFPSFFTNNVLFVVLIFLFIISRNFKASDRDFSFLTLGFLWSLFLLLVYKVGGFLEARAGAGYMYHHFHINTNSILSLHNYYFLFLLLLLFEGRLKAPFKKLELLFNKFTKTFLQPLVLWIAEKINVK
jgi:hypothetical protein